MCGVAQFRVHTLDAEKSEKSAYGAETTSTFLFSVSLQSFLVQVQ